MDTNNAFKKERSKRTILMNDPFNSSDYRFPMGSIVKFSAAYLIHHRWVLEHVIKWRQAKVERAMTIVRSWRMKIIKGNDEFDDFEYAIKLDAFMCPVEGHMVAVRIKLRYFELADEYSC
jgi:hypothetical protein